MSLDYGSRTCPDCDRLRAEMERRALEELTAQGEWIEITGKLRNERDLAWSSFVALQQRLDAVIALCDQWNDWRAASPEHIRQVRAAATGEQ